MAQSLGRKGTLSRRNDYHAPGDPRDRSTPTNAYSGRETRFLPNPETDSGRYTIKKPPAIALSEPFPLLDPGQYVAVCTEATFAWARQWNKWIARLVLEPLNYQGRPYTGRLCKFLGLGKNKERPTQDRRAISGNCTWK